MKEVAMPSNFKWKLRSGEDILFWEDIWNGDIPLKDKFKKLYSISKLTYSTVLKFTSVWLRPNNSQDELWKRRLRDWEVEEVESLSEIVSGIHFLSGKDILFWSYSGHAYSVSKITSFLQIHSNVIWSFIWRLKVPHKIRVFL